MANTTVQKTRTTKKPVAKAKKTTYNTAKTASNCLEKKVEEKAYELFSRKGYLHGSDILDWTLAQDLVELENKAVSSKKFLKINTRPKKLNEEVEKWAYELYEYRGRTHGNDVFDWSLAEEITFLRSNIR